MARIRTVKPEFWMNEDLASVSESARLLAIGVLNLADDEGWLKCHPKLIEGSLFPFSEPSVSVHECLIQLQNIGYLAIYKSVDGKEYAHVVKFNEHQKINRPTPSKIKDAAGLTEYSLIAHGALTGGKERKGREVKGMEWKGNMSNDEGKPTVGDKPKTISPQALSGKPDPALDIFNHWVLVMGKSGGVRFTTDRRKMVVARLKEGYEVETIKLAIDGCALTPHNMGFNDRNTKYLGLELICKNGANIERFADNAIDPPDPSKSAKDLQNDARTAQVLDAIDVAEVVDFSDCVLFNGRDESTDDNTILIEHNSGH